MHMDRTNFKEIQCVASFVIPEIFMVEKSAQFDIWNKKIFFFSVFQRVPNDLAHFSYLDLAENLKNEHFSTTIKMMAKKIHAHFSGQTDINTYLITLHIWAQH